MRDCSIFDRLLRFFRKKTSKQRPLQIVRSSLHNFPKYAINCIPLVLELLSVIKRKYSTITFHRILLAISVSRCTRIHFQIAHRCPVGFFDPQFCCLIPSPIVSHCTFINNDSKYYFQRSYRSLTLLTTAPKVSFTSPISPVTRGGCNRPNLPSTAYTRAVPSGWK